MKISRKNSFICLTAFSILVTPGISYGPLYPFHILAPLILLFIYLSISQDNFKVNKVILGSIVLFTYVLFSSLFLNDFILLGPYLFYFICLIICFYFGYFLSKDNLYRKYLIKIILSFSLILTVIGLLESLNIVRMPFSPYSDYYSFFGKTKDLSDWNEDLYLYNTQKPTGFSANPNTFGFVFLIFLPFLELIKSNILRFSLFIASIFIVFKIDSKTIFLAFLIYISLSLIINSKTKIKNFMLLAFTLLIFLIVFPLIELPENRIFLVFSELQKGIDFLFSSNESFTESGSTAKRALIYSIGIEQLFNSYGLGLGISGIESYLALKFGEHTAFHNFFLMMLIDLGFIGFTFIVIFYVSLLYKLYIKYKMTNYILYKILFLSILTSLISSIAPSGIFYILPYWFILGISCYYAYSKESHL